MDLGLKGSRVLVTAGGNGIGLAIARRFAAEGAKVHTCDVDPAALAALAASDAAITSTKCDVSDRSAVDKLFAETLEKLGGLDVLVNNAGIAGPTSGIEEMHPEDWDRCVAICLTGQFNCTRLAVPHLRNSKNASIVNISSAAGRLGFAMRTPYAAAKWGVIGLTKSLSVELGPDDIRVMRSCRGWSRVTGSAGSLKPRRSSVVFVLRDGANGVFIYVNQGLRHARADCRPDPVHVQFARQDDFRAGDLDLRRHPDAGASGADLTFAIHLPRFPYANVKSKAPLGRGLIKPEPEADASDFDHGEIVEGLRSYRVAM